MTKPVWKSLGMFFLPAIVGQVAANSWGLTRKTLILYGLDEGNAGAAAWLTLFCASMVMGGIAMYQVLSKDDNR